MVRRVDNRQPKFDTIIDVDIRNQNQPKSTKINQNQPKSTKINQNQPKSNRVADHAGRLVRPPCKIHTLFIWRILQGEVVCVYA
jgi:hypothetical protein